MSWLDLVTRAFAERQAEMAMLPLWVKNWVLFMRVLFFSGVIFTPWWKAPRYVVATLVLTGLTILSAKIFLPQFNTLFVGTIVQLVLWSFLLIYLLANWRQDLRPPLVSGKIFSTIFGIWALATIVVLTIAQLFNLLDLARALFG